MSNCIKNRLVVILLAFVFFSMSIIAWIKPSNEFSDSERRYLTAYPELTIDHVLSGQWMRSFESYTVDQFPWRNNFRGIKALTAFHVFNLATNNDIYLEDTYLSEIEYPLNESSLAYAGDVFTKIYDRYLADANTNNFLSIIPDKNYFLAADADQLVMDYSALAERVQASSPPLNYIDIFDHLSIDDYYHTDTHWRQENLLDLAKAISGEMGTTLCATYETNTASDNFLGVYHGRLALPVIGERLNYLTSPYFDDLIVYDRENNREIPIYDFSNHQSKDPYTLFLSGPLSLITIDNPNATTSKELIIFRDSFASSIAPLFSEAYSKVTLIDIRYLPADYLGQFIDFSSQDVLFLYSSLILNNSAALK